MIQVGSNVQVNPLFLNVTNDQLCDFDLASLEVLDSVGVIVESEEALKILEEAGCIVDENLVRFPASVVKKALRNVPPRITLSDSVGNRSVFFERNKVFFGACLGQRNVFDLEKGLVRETIKNDIENVTRIAETLESIDFISLNAGDDLRISLKNYLLVRSHSVKPMIIDVKDPVITQSLIDLAAECSNNYSKQNFTHTAFHLQSLSPLVLRKTDTDIIKICCNANIPVAYTSQLILGVTTPNDLESAIVLGVANVLAVLVLSQLIRNGSQFAIGLNLLLKETNNFGYISASPEFYKSLSIFSQISRFYNIPSIGITARTDAITINQQSALEATYSILASTLAGVNINLCFGNSDVLNYEYLIMANEIICMTKHFMKGIEVSEETIPIDIIDEVGAGGEYITSPHTMKYFKTANYFPRFINRQHFSIWLEEDQKTMGQKMALRALNILKEPIEIKLPEDILTSLNEMVEKYNHTEHNKGVLEC
jgi:trimethylamine---corrinoid protein Co-methyltransferase